MIDPLSSKYMLSNFKVSFSAQHNSCHSKLKLNHLSYEFYAKGYTRVEKSVQTRINLKHLFYLREICDLNSACNYRSELPKIKYLFSISLRFELWQGKISRH